MIVYLHGFSSGPQSYKVQMLKRRMAEKGLADALWCEQLPTQPAQAARLIDTVIAGCDTPPTLVGSSLGGFFATVMAERYGLRAVLINPVVLKTLSPEGFVGKHVHLYTGEAFTFRQSHFDELAALDIPAITQPQRYWLLVETGDEVLPWRHAVDFYAGAKQTVLPGGDHSFTRWGDYLDEVLDFAGLLDAGR